jgi:hypothetical protein
MTSYSVVTCGLRGTVCYKVSVDSFWTEGRSEDEAARSCFVLRKCKRAGHCLSIFTTTFFCAHCVVVVTVGNGALSSGPLFP